MRKATLRDWREKFAGQLRAVAVAANATPRLVRGETKSRKTHGVYRATRRGASTNKRERVRPLSRTAGQITFVETGLYGAAHSGYPRQVTHRASTWLRLAPRQSLFKLAWQNLNSEIAYS